MNTKEARQKSESVFSGKYSTQYKAVLLVINEQVGKGKFKAYFYKSLSLGVANKLTMDGYHISEYDDQRDGATTTISWK